MILAVDTETRGLDARKFVCGVIVWENGRSESFLDKELMYQRLIKEIMMNAARGHKTYIYGHNHEYDFYAYARNHWQDEGFRYLNLSPFIVIYQGAGYFLDSYNIFKMSLAQLGQMISSPKSTMHPKLLNDTDEITMEDMHDIIEYCRNDAFIVLQSILMLKRTLREIGLNPKKLTTAAQIAMSCFVAYLARTKQWYNLTEKGNYGKIIGTKFDKQVRTAFRGGRNEAFQTGEFYDTTYLDINSLYPFIMSHMTMPNLTTEEMLHKPTPQEFEELMNKPGFVEATVEIPKLEIGFLPIRYDGYLLFPRKEGLKLHSWWTIDEIRLAMQEGYKIIDVNKAITYKTIYNPFRDYMRMLYDKRIQSTGAANGILKILMNSLFGKFAQKETKTELKFIHRRDYKEYADWQIKGSFGEYYAITRSITDERRYFVNPVLPALITSWARIYLYGFLKQIKQEDLLYCDTDSIILTNFDRYKSIFSIGREMGKWKIVSNDDSTDIKGEKKYRIGDWVKCSGVSGIISREQFESGRITSKKMVTLNQASDPDSVGMFTDNVFQIETKCKNDIKIKEAIIHDIKTEKEKGNTEDRRPLGELYEN